MKGSRGLSDPPQNRRIKMLKNYKQLKVVHVYENRSEERNKGG
jgi:hypothetical protein